MTSSIVLAVTGVPMISVTAPVEPIWTAHALKPLDPPLEMSDVHASMFRNGTPLAAIEAISAVVGSTAATRPARHIWMAPAHVVPPDALSLKKHRPLLSRPRSPG